VLSRKAINEYPAGEYWLSDTTGEIEGICIDTGENSLPIEFAVVAQLPAGSGSALLADGLSRQKEHPEYIFEYNEHGAKIANTDIFKSEVTAVYSVGVDRQDLVFHRHEGHRILVVTSGSRGAALRFSYATPAEVNADPMSFLNKMVVVNAARDMLFTMRFGPGVYHQFGPIDDDYGAFLAISIHSNELAGLSGELLAKVKSGNGHLDVLTEPVPSAVEELLAREELTREVPHLSLGTRPE
jgi:hypothetical protein